jgi:hypothetical protein
MSPAVPVPAPAPAVVDPKNIVALAALLQHVRAHGLRHAYSLRVIALRGGAQ